jgi:RES domain-containing protein
MPVTAWRIVKPRFAKPPVAAFDGEGARRFGGRWNSKGVPMVYLGGSLALAALELLVHLESDGLDHHIAIPVTIPDELVLELSAISTKALPRTWTNNHVLTRNLGDSWIASRHSLALRVPSAVIPQETNVLLNPLHPDMATLGIGKAQAFHFDQRLAKR